MMARAHARARTHTANQAKGGNTELPVLVDANTDAILHADDIVPYLWETYGPLQVTHARTRTHARTHTHMERARST